MQTEQLQKLSTGQIAVQYDGKSQGVLETIIHKAFPDSTRIPAGISKYYLMGINDWCGTDSKPLLPVEPLKSFSD